MRTNETYFQSPTTDFCGFDNFEDNLFKSKMTKGKGINKTLEY